MADKFSYHILPVNRINNSVNFSTITGSGEPTRLIQLTAELKFEVAVKFVGMTVDAIPTCNQNKYRLHLSPFVVTSSLLCAIDEPLFDHHWRGKTFYNFNSGLKYKTNF